MATSTQYDAAVSAATIATDAGARHASTRKHKYELTPVWACYDNQRVVYRVFVHVSCLCDDRPAFDADSKLPEVEFCEEKDDDDASMLPAAPPADLQPLFHRFMVSVCDFMHNPSACCCLLF